MKRILFVDDEPKVLEALQRMLRFYRNRWEMTFVSSGVEALLRLGAESFDVIVTDVRMPGMDGIQLLEQVQKLFPTVIRIVLSGYFEREAALRAAGLAHKYLAKPCGPSELYETIDDLCHSNAILTNEAARGAVSAIGSLPSPPQTYTTLKRTLQKGNVSMEEVAQIIEQDVAMSAKVLQLVNSPLFGTAGEVTDVRRALACIGVAALREVVLSVEIFQAFEPEPHIEGFSLEAFQSHCALTARIAGRLPVPAGLRQVSMMTALLHDTGKLVLAACLPGPFQRALRKSLSEQRPLYAVEQEVIGSTHAQIGAYLLSLWGLSQTMVDAVWSHHRPSAVRTSVVPPGAEGLDVLAITHIANALAGEIESGAPPEEPPAAGRWDLEYLDQLRVADQIPGWRQAAREIASPIEI